MQLWTWAGGKAFALPCSTWGGRQPSCLGRRLHDPCKTNDVWQTNASQCYRTHTCMRPMQGSSSNVNGDQRSALFVPHMQSLPVATFVWPRGMSGARGVRSVAWQIWLMVATGVQGCRGAKHVCRHSWLWTANGQPDVGDHRMHRGWMWRVGGCGSDTTFGIARQWCWRQRTTPHQAQAFQ